MRADPGARKERLCHTKGLSTREAGRGHATPHMPVETAKCWWLLKIEPNAWAGGKGSCVVCVDLQAVGALEFFGELYSLAKGFGPFLRGFGQALEKGRVLFLVTTSTSPSLQAYAELHALSPLRGSISPWPYLFPGSHTNFHKTTPKISGRGTHCKGLV